MPDSVADLIRERATHPQTSGRPFILFGDRRISYAEYYRQSCRFAQLFLSFRPRDRPAHAGILLDNTPDYLFALGGAALAGVVAVGINNTKRGEHLARDLAHTDCDLLVTESRYRPLIEPIVAHLPFASERVFVSRRWDSATDSLGPNDAAAPFSDLDASLDLWRDAADPGHEPKPEDRYVLLFTSGTVTAPKAVICSHGRLRQTGQNIGRITYELSGDDVGYIAMPLFHANALMCGWMPALACGAAVALARKFTKTGWLSDIRRYGATYFNYTGKPLAYILSTPEQPSDADNPLRICFGNEGSHRVVEEFERRFACRVIDVFGASEGGLGVTRQPGDPPTSIGMPAPGILVVDEAGNERRRARFDRNGRLLNDEEAVGEIVNTLGTAWFEGYYKNGDATEHRTRNGWYWSGDLGYRDDQGYLYFAGRDVEWLRVDGENFLARPVEEILQRYEPVVLATVYGVPDPDGGDRVMTALVLRAGVTFDPAAFDAFLAQQADLSPKWLPTYVRLATELPQTASAKVLKTELRRQKFRPDRCPDPVYWRPSASSQLRPFASSDYEALRRRFAETDRLEMLER